MALKDYKSAQQSAGYTDGDRPLGDHYSTPRIAVEKLLLSETFGKYAWEPCCGNGAISKILEENGFTVKSTDLYDWGYGETGKDFLTEPLIDVETIITNPPFNISYDFAIRALEATKNKKGKVALLNRLSWLEGIKRKELFTKYPLSKVLVFSKRIPRMHRPDYTGKEGTSMLAFAWFIFDWSHVGPTTIEWI